MRWNTLLKAAITTGLFSFFAPATNAQYYYKDIINNHDVTAELARLKEQKIKTINVTSLESNGMQSEGFFCRKKINKNFTEVEVFTRTSTSYPNIFTSIYSKEGVLKQTIDSSEVSSTNTYYSYDAAGNLLRTNSSTDFAEDDDRDIVSEDHIYEYNTTGAPVKMLLIKNKKDTTTLLFQLDEQNHVAIEKNSVTAEVYYYYYDGRGRITQIVHGYAGNKSLVPDYKFDYNSAGLIAQMIATENEGAFFFTWKYNYEGGLRTMERCYSKEGSLMGSAEYEYK